MSAIFHSNIVLAQDVVKKDVFKLLSCSGKEKLFVSPISLDSSIVIYQSCEPSGNIIDTKKILYETGKCGEKEYLDVGVDVFDDKVEVVQTCLPDLLK